MQGRRTGADARMLNRAIDELTRLREETINLCKAAHMYWKERRFSSTIQVRWGVINRTRGQQRHEQLDRARLTTK
jgi:hypothetical protein